MWSYITKNKIMINRTSVQAYNKKIRNRLYKELIYATDSVQISMCYFNDGALLKLLSIKAFAGIKISIVIDDNKVNQRFSPSLQAAADLGCTIHWSTHSRLMHSKYVIIDGEKLITGSYNLTNAAPNNHENIVVIENNPRLVNFFQQDHDLLKNSCHIIDPKENIEEENQFLTPLMKSRIFSIENNESFSIPASLFNKQLMLDFKWNHFKNLPIMLQDLFAENEEGRTVENLFKKFPELTNQLSNIPYALLIKCTLCGDETIQSWFSIHPNKSGRCSACKTKINKKNSN